MLFRKIIKAVRGKSEKDAFYGFLMQFLGRKTKRKDLYLLAFRHKSASLYEKGKKLNNERLEYLGDAVLDAIVADVLFRKYPEQKEGFLTKLRSKIVSRKQLNAIGYALQLDKYLLFKGVMTDNLVGNCVEALVGAVYLDFGYEKTKKIVEKQLLERFVDIEVLVRNDENFKSKLVEWVQSRKQTVAFLTEEKEKNGRPYFFSEVLIDAETQGRGEGWSKKQAEQLAAKKTLDKVRK